VGIGRESRRARLDVMSDGAAQRAGRLTELAVRACGTSPACRDYTRGEIEAVLAELLAGYPTYGPTSGGRPPIRWLARRVTVRVVARVVPG